ncbi:hypothetical protein [Thiospirillum jenense]|uniref:Uncharacterized protein n=1 Tax=Thiospirillum jenense TaxID=1653858 RepID=A0A839HBL6_9GAMM|nr:hypothetical protein [Thiospirillum jenense]MBB1126373.1 hypothetical protein [Thiospirillum jenense]
MRTAACPDGQLLVRARRAGDIEKLWATAEVIMTKGCDYLYRAFIPEQEVADAIALSVVGIDYPNFKESVTDHALHHAYYRVWRALSEVQHPAPYSLE